MRAIKRKAEEETKKQADEANKKMKAKVEEARLKLEEEFKKRGAVALQMAQKRDSGTSCK